LNPISIIITGYHNQFDNLALLVGALSVIIFGDDFEKPLSRKKLIGLFVLGLSIMTKHVLFVFPLWLAVKQKGFLNKVAVIVVPLAVFALGFIPYLKDGQQGIVQHVLLYKAYKNLIFFDLFVPGILRSFTDGLSIWFFLLVVFAIVLRKQKSFDSLLLYTCLLVAASPATSNQYFAIPLMFVAVNPNVFLILYTIVGTWHLMVDENGLHSGRLQSILHIQQHDYYGALIVLLCFGFIWQLWGKEILAFIKKGGAEIKSALT
jgi:hypothetical protein